MYLTQEQREENRRAPAPDMLKMGGFTPAECLAGERWRTTYLMYLRSLEDDDMPDADCEEAKACYMRGVEILEGQDLSKPYCKRKRVFHAVNAVCVYGEPDELGDHAMINAAAKVGLADLVKHNFEGPRGYRPPSKTGWASTLPAEPQPNFWIAASRDNG
jgi:hypothetical protein